MIHIVVMILTLRWFKITIQLYCHALSTRKTISGKEEGYAFSDE